MTLLVRSCNFAASWPCRIGVYRLTEHSRVAYLLDVLTSGGSSDAYLKLKVKGHKKYRTSTVRRTRHPIWKEEFTLYDAVAVDRVVVEGHLHLTFGSVRDSTVKTLDQSLFIKLMDQDFLRDSMLLFCLGSYLCTLL